MTPICCNPKAIELMRACAANIESPDALLNGAVAASLNQVEDANLGAVDQKVQRYVDTVRGRVRGSQPQAILAHLHELLFEEERFVGNLSDFFNPLNAYLPSALDRKSGLPITLALIYKLVAERLGLRVWGVGLPGHFVCGVKCDGATLLVDAYNGGRILTAEEAEARMRHVMGEGLTLTPDMFEPVCTKHWLTRILQNLLNVFGAAGQLTDVAAMLELEMILWPDQVRLHRDVALVYARTGMSRPAMEHLTHYLNVEPSDPQGSDLRQLLNVLTT